MKKMASLLTVMSLAAAMVPAATFAATAPTAAQAQVSPIVLHKAPSVIQPMVYGSSGNYYTATSGNRSFDFINNVTDSYSMTVTSTSNVEIDLSSVSGSYDFGVVLTSQNGNSTGTHYVSNSSPYTIFTSMLPGTYTCTLYNYDGTYHTGNVDEYWDGY